MQQTNQNSKIEKIRLFAKQQEDELLRKGQNADTQMQIECYRAARNAMRDVQFFMDKLDKEDVS